MIAADRARGVVLVYHRVHAHAQDFFQLGIEPERFRSHLEIVRRLYTAVRLEEISRPSEGVKNGNVAVTFDDGYASNLEASEILIEHGVPATFFVNSGALGATEERFWDQLERVFFDPVYPPPCEWPTKDATDRARVFERVHAELMRADFAERERLMREILAESAVPRPPRPEFRSLSVAELVELGGRPGHSIGAHGENHLFLPALTPEICTREVVADKRRLEQMLGREVAHFSYPFGANDSASRKAVRDAGFALAVGCAPAAVTEHSDRWALPRLDATPLDGPALETTLRALLGG